MKKRLLFLVLLPLMLCACAEDLPQESIVLETSLPTEPPEKITFSAQNMEDFRFETTCSILENNVYSRYSGEIIDEDIKSQLWEMLCAQEQMDTYQGGSCGGSTQLLLTHKRTGKTFSAGYAIWYAHPDHEGGPICFVISGSSCGTVCYYPVDDAADPEVFASERFEALLAAGVKREENLVS